MNNTIKVSKTGISITLNGVQLPNDGRLPKHLESFGLINYETSAQDVIADFASSEACASLTAKYYAKRDARMEELTSHIATMNEVKQALPAGSVEDLYEYVKHLASTGNGWEAVDILIGDNKLSNILFNKLGSFTATPFDDGNIFLKGEKGKASLKRGTNRQTISSLITN
jgi:hypothetical protein